MACCCGKKPEEEEPGEMIGKQAFKNPLGEESEEVRTTLPTILPKAIAL